MCAQSSYCLSLLSYGCMCSILLVWMKRSSAYDVLVMVFGEVFKWYPSWSILSYPSRGSRKMMNENELNMSAWMMPWLFWIGGIVMKWAP